MLEIGSRARRDAGLDRFKGGASQHTSSVFHRKDAFSGSIPRLDSDDRGLSVIAPGMLSVNYNS